MAITFALHLFCSPSYLNSPAFLACRSNWSVMLAVFPTSQLVSKRNLQVSKYLYRSFLIILHCSLSWPYLNVFPVTKKYNKASPLNSSVVSPWEVNILHSTTRRFFRHLSFSLLTPSCLGHNVPGWILSSIPRAADPLHANFNLDSWSLLFHLVVFTDCEVNLMILAYVLTQFSAEIFLTHSLNY